MSTPLRPHTTAAFYAQASISFGVSLVAMCIGIAYLPLANWPRAFLALGLLFTITSAFTLAKCVRQGGSGQLLSEQDVLRVNVP